WGAAILGKLSLKSRRKGWKHKVAAQFLKHNLAEAARLCFNSQIAVPAVIQSGPIVEQRLPLVLLSNVVEG
ncbi:MAG: hypothetical protein ACREEM_48395, partial [Blastocatellia bacterium]